MMLRRKSDEVKRRKIEAMYEKSRRKFFPDVPEIAVEELRDRLSDGDKIVVVDVRSPNEQAVSMIAGAVTVQEFERDMDTYHGSTVVAYCTVGHRSGLFAKTLGERGFDALNLRGAILAWTHADGALENTDGPTRTVHVWGSKYSFEAESYDPVW